MTALTQDLLSCALTSNQARMLGDTQQTGIIANGLTQGTATALTGSICNVGTVTAANNGVILPLAATTPHSWVFVRNSDAADTLNVWPATGEAINALVNTPVAVAVGTAKIFCKLGSGWITT